MHIQGSGGLTPTPGDVTMGAHDTETRPTSQPHRPPLFEDITPETQAKLETMKGNAQNLKSLNRKFAFFNFLSNFPIIGCCFASKCTQLHNLIGNERGQMQGEAKRQLERLNKQIEHLNKLPTINNTTFSSLTDEQKAIAKLRELYCRVLGQPVPDDPLQRACKAQEERQKDTGGYSSGGSNTSFLQFLVEVSLIQMIINQAR